MDTAAERQLLPHVLTRNIELVGFGEGLGSRLTAPGQIITVDPAGTSVSLRVVSAAPPRAEIALDRTFQPQRLLDEGGDRAAVVAQLLLQVRAFADDPSAAVISLVVVSCPAANKNVAVHHLDQLGNSAVAVGGFREQRQHIVAGVLAAVGGQAVNLVSSHSNGFSAITSLSRAPGGHPARCAEHGAEFVVLLGTPRAGRRSSAVRRICRSGPSTRMSWCR